MPYALFGGSFDPPHDGHIAMARAAREALGVDEVIFIPNARNPLKARAEASPAHRLRMVEIAIQDEEGFSASDVETSRGGRSFAVETVEEMTLIRPGEKAWFLLGTDALAGIMQWKSPERLVKLCRLGVFARPGTEVDKALRMVSDEIADRVDIIPAPLHAASSSLVREEIMRGISPERWIDTRVWSYIQQHGLYALDETP